MTKDDLHKIEDELGLKVPIMLRSIWLNYPLKAESGNNEQYIWDNAKLISRREYQVERKEKMAI